MHFTNFLRNISELKRLLSNMEQETVVKQTNTVDIHIRTAKEANQKQNGLYISIPG